MKITWITILLLGFFFLQILPKEANACEIEFEIIKGGKDTYQTGDTLVVKVNVILTHRSCPIAIKKTQFKTNGLKVIKSTSWKQLTSMEYERKLLIVVGKPKKGKLMINATRTCDKDGGFGSMKLESAIN
ncbi:MAG: hypothetical protein K8R41_10145 [Bacteroidales bacterium]|nr:hypothetical protein [Bacteroidales bacterium]